MRISKPLIALLLVALVVAIAAAVYTMNSDPSDTVIVSPTPTPTASPSPTPTQQPQATLSKVSVSTTMLTVGAQLTLSTTVSDGTPDLTVTFYDQENTAVGSAVTDATGKATLTITPPVGSWSYHATAEHP
jgi:hypothetical protein